MKFRKRTNNKIVKGDVCLNCGNNLNNNEDYCPKCGQFNDTSRVLFKDLVRDIFGYFFFYDFRLKNSLKLLLFKPGQLSINLISGKKVDYIHPIRLFFIVSLIFFTISSINDSKTNNKDGNDFVVLDVNNNNVNTEVDEEDIDFNTLFAISDTTVIDSAVINDAKNSSIDLFGLSLIAIKKNKNLSVDEFFAEYGIENSTINNFVFNKAKEYSCVTLSEFFSLIERKFNLIVFLFMPFFVVLLLLLHYKKDIYYYEHLIFTFNTQTALFLMLIFAEIVSFFSESFGSTLSGILNFAVFPIYLFLALKRFYKYKTYLRTLLMFILINLGFVILAPIFFVLSILFFFFIY